MRAQAHAAPPDMWNSSEESKTDWTEASVSVTARPVFILVPLKLVKTVFILVPLKLVKI